MSPVEETKKIEISTECLRDLNRIINSMGDDGVAYVKSELTDDTFEIKVGMEYGDELSFMFSLK